MRDKKRRLEFFSFYDHTGIAAHLERMAAKGWLLEKMGSFGWLYRRVEPKLLRFAVSFYPKASMYDPEPSEDQKTFQDFCRHAGWIPVEATGPMQVFYNEAEDPTPIATDPEMEVETLHQAVKKSYLPSYWVLLILGLVQLTMMLVSLAADTIGYLTNSSYLMATFDWLLVILMSLAELTGYYSWRRRAQKAAQEGVFLPSRGTAGLQKVCLVLVLLAGGFWLAGILTSAPNFLRVISLGVIAYAILMCLVVQGVTALMKKKKASAKWNKAATWGAIVLMGILLLVLVLLGVLWAERAVKNTEKQPRQDNTFSIIAYNDKLPLTLNDLTGETYKGYSSRMTGSGSFLLERYTMYQHPVTDTQKPGRYDLDYTVCRIKAPFLYDTVKREVMRRTGSLDPETVLHCEPIDPAPWGAEEAYALRLPKEFGGSRSWPYLLCYRDTIVHISFDWEPTPDQMAMVGEKLGK